MSLPEDFFDKLTHHVFRLLAGREPETALRETFQYLGRELSGPLSLVGMILWEISSGSFKVLIEWKEENFMAKSKIIEEEYSRAGKHSKKLEYSFKKILETSEPLYIKDYSELNNPFARINTRFGIRSAYLLPCSVKEERSILLGILSSRPDAFDSQAMKFFGEILPSLRAVSRSWHFQKEILSLNNELEERVEQKTRELQTILDFSRKLSFVKDFRQLLLLTVRYLKRVVRIDIVSAFLSTEDERHLYIYCSHRISEALIETLKRRIFAEYEKNCNKTVNEEVKIVLLEGIAPANGNKERGTLDYSGKTENKLDQIVTTLIFPVRTTNLSTPDGLVLLGFKNRKRINAEKEKLIHAIIDQASISIMALNGLIKNERENLQWIMEKMPGDIVFLDDSFRILYMNARARKDMSLCCKIQNNTLKKIGDMEISDFKNPLLLNKKWTVIRIHEPEERFYHAMLIDGAFDIRWIFVFHDVTEEVKLRERTEQLNILATMGQLSAGIAHDFNNILTGIITFTRYLISKQDIPRYAKSYLEKIEKEGNRAVKLIDQLMDFGRQKPSEMAEINLEKFIEDFASEIEKTLPENIDLELKIGKMRTIIRVNPAHMKQILSNIVSNSIEAMKNGGKITIFVDDFILEEDETPPFYEMKPGKWIKLGISDTGKGIPGAVLPRIFNPFFTTKEVGKGTGLGLAQVYGLVRQNEGFVEVKSKESEGTTIILYFPAIPGDD